MALLPNILFLFIIAGPVLIMHTLTKPIVNSFIFYTPIHVVRLITQTLIDRPVVGLRLPELIILIAALWAVTSCGQFQTLVPIVSEERIVSI